MYKNKKAYISAILKTNLNVKFNCNNALSVRNIT